MYAFSGCWWRFHTPLLSVVAAQEEATTRRGRDIDRGRMMIYILLLVLYVCFLFFVGRCSTIISTITNAPHISSSILVVVIIFILNNPKYYYYYSSSSSSAAVVVVSSSSCMRLLYHITPDLFDILFVYTLTSTTGTFLSRDNRKTLFQNYRIHVNAVNADYAKACCYYYSRSVSAWKCRQYRGSSQ